MDSDKMLSVDAILETALYVDDLARASGFYSEVFGFEALVESPRLCALDVGGKSVLLLFQRGATADGLRAAGGFIPPHDGTGPSHFAFAIRLEDVARWEAHLAQHGVEIESKVKWDRGGISLYFRDPDNHSVELVTRGTWKIF
jgi:catechol 2,3-dioxygenase-like lactoylglutathione lyase family enzyme